jgi:hypothetical protein
MKNAWFFLIVLAGVLFSAPVASCQNTAQSATSNQEDLALLKQDVKSQKKQIVAANLELTDTEATKFWPIYDKYTADMSKISDTRMALVKEYADAYPNVTDAQAQSIVQRWLKTDEQVAQLREQYMPMLERCCRGKRWPDSFRSIGALESW